MLVATHPADAAASPPVTAAALSPAQRCAGLSGLRLPDTTVQSATTNTSGSFTVPPGPGAPGADKPGTVLADLPAYCDVRLVRTNPPTHDEVNIELWLPLTAWNHRFQGVGGSGFVSGISYTALAGALKGGYATASTDTGHLALQWDGSFALKAPGELDSAAIRDFADRAVHEMTVAGKQVTTDFYRRQADYSYFTGCSQGGRQGLVEAQRYPHDYDGILSGAPAVSFSKLSAAQLWPQFVMQRAHDFVPSCKFAAFQAAVVAHCDALDGVTDGVIGNVDACRFDLRTLVGRATACGTITRTDATVMAQIWQGPRTGEQGRGRSRFLWYGLEPGTSTNALALTLPVNGQLTGRPLYFGTSWLQYWVTRNPSFDWTTLTTQTYDMLFGRGVDRFGAELDGDNPDLSRFHAGGGKLVLWAGLADYAIPPQGVIRYYDAVRHLDGAQVTQTYARLFLAPGVGHCGDVPGLQIGPVPVDPLAALTSWVEHGHAPRSIGAVRNGDDGKIVQTRPLCAYPLVARYDGHGSTDVADNFTCARSYGSSDSSSSARSTASSRSSTCWLAQSSPARIRWHRQAATTSALVSSTACSTTTRRWSGSDRNGSRANRSTATVPVPKPSKSTTALRSSPSKSMLRNVKSP
ncbi:tannase/feruloyl esterase family alpha/beta hydrolase [Actinopolymorpha rutila]|uniref:tannase/feruloyl esterase family alpha/beta hydrolase n=1 Tax=Actinopolymorpha rutila TaxID=446787 RepID=UPI0023536F34|nr:tannase/feruloyl esterase family alpha/beta hydrolase [Actinopolymorpha rutila]